MTYEFKGYVDAVDGDQCMLVMYDATEPRNPTEHWIIAQASLPRPVVAGEYVDFKITDADGVATGIFTVGKAKTWTAEEIAAVKMRARRLAWALR